MTKLIAVWCSDGFWIGVIAGVAYSLASAVTLIMLMRLAQPEPELPAEYQNE